MTEETDKQKARAEQDRRIAESLRANLRRRKKAQAPASQKRDGREQPEEPGP